MSFAKCSYKGSTHKVRNIIVIVSLHINFVVLIHICITVKGTCSNQDLLKLDCLYIHCQGTVLWEGKVVAKGR